MKYLLEFVFTDKTKTIIMYDDKICDPTSKILKSDFVDGILECTAKNIAIGHDDMPFYSNINLPFTFEEFSKYLEKSSELEYLLINHFFNNDDNIKNMLLPHKNNRLKMIDILNKYSFVETYIIPHNYVKLGNNWFDASDTSLRVAMIKHSISSNINLRVYFLDIECLRPINFGSKRPPEEICIRACIMLGNNNIFSEFKSSHRETRVTNIQFHCEFIETYEYCYFINISENAKIIIKLILYPSTVVTTLLSLNKETAFFDVKNEYRDLLKELVSCDTIENYVQVLNNTSYKEKLCVFADNNIIDLGKVTVCGIAEIM